VSRFARDKVAHANKRLVKSYPVRDQLDLTPGSTMLALVLGSTNETTVVMDIATKAMVRWRVPWPAHLDSDLKAFDLVEATLADDLERDDLAAPEAITLADLPRRLGSLRTRQVRRWLEEQAAPPDGALFGFRGPSAPYWEFTGSRPSVALIVPERGPQLLRRAEDNSTWVRFGWQGDDIWLLCEDQEAIRALEGTRLYSLSGRDLQVALGFRPAYILATLSKPFDGHVYKSCTGILPRN
jgi:hypothetical protein